MNVAVSDAAPNASVVQVRPIGALANRMIQHMTAVSIAARVPGARISRIHLPEWGIDEPDLPVLPEPVIDLRGMVADVDDLAARLRDGRIGTVSISGYMQHVGNFLDRSAYQDMFRSALPVRGYDEDTLLINLRMAEILTPDYPNYVLLPIAWYRRVIDDTGLRPVFFGQLTPSPYLDALVEAFPDARFVPGSGAIHDFETLRRSRNVVASVSTFSWLACWLSDADRIVLPLSGLFNPIQGAIWIGGIDLVPKDDPRYILHLFPLNEAVSQERVPFVHAAIAPRVRPASGAWIRAILADRLTRERSLDDHLAIFDEGEYLARYVELAAARDAGVIKDGCDHYRLHGFREKRVPCAIGIDYAYRYPDAGIAVAEGRFVDLAHFHAAHGRHLGYVVPAAGTVFA